MKNHAEFIPGRSYRRHCHEKYRCVGHLEDGTALVENLNDLGEVKYIAKPREWEETPNLKKKSWWLNIYPDKVCVHVSDAAAFHGSSPSLIETRRIDVEWEEKP